MILEEVRSAWPIYSTSIERNQSFHYEKRDMLSMRSILCTFCDECDALLFLSITLQDSSGGGRIDKLTERILDDVNSIAKHGSHLTIGPFQAKHFFRY